MADSGLVVGIDLGGTKVLACVITAKGEILGREKERTQRINSEEGIFQAIISAVEGAMAQAEVEKGMLQAIGVGAPGTLDPDSGTILFSPNMPLRNFALAQKLGDAFGCPCYVGNDANMGVFGEWTRGAGQGVSNMIGVFVGTGIGGGLVLDNQLYEGSGRVAGEIGHMVVQMGGPKCGCGNRGCLEAMASRTAISNTLYKAIQKGEKSQLAGKFKGNPPAVRSKALSKAFAEGDRLVRRIVNEAAEILGMGLGSLANILSPEMIVLGGGVVDALGQEYVKIASTVALNWTFEANRKVLKIVPAQLGDDAIVHGAASWARMRLQRDYPVLSPRMQ